MEGSFMGAASVQMPEDERERVKFLGGMFQKSAQYRYRWDRHWPRWWNLWEGNHYYGKIVHTLTRACVNQVFSSIETFVGHASDILTAPNVFGRREQLRETAKLVTKWLKTCWDQSNAETEIQHVIRSSSVTGVGWIEIPWDTSSNDGRGNPGFLPKDERFMFVSPGARNLQEALYLMEVCNVPREFVENSWEKGKEVPPGVWFPQVNNQRNYTGPNPEDGQFAEFMTTDQSQTGWTHLAGMDNKSMRDQVTLMKAWIRQRDGSMRLAVVSNGVLLQDGPSPYDDEDYPYVQMNLLPTLESPYGRSLVQFVESLQEVIDESLSYLLDVQHYAADPMLVVNQVNIEEGQLIENAPGAILFDRSEGSNGYNWLQGPGFNQSWMQILDVITGAMDSVLGRVDVLKGERPAGVNTLGGLEIIRDEANVRMRNLMRWVKAGVKRSYLLMLSRLRQFVQEEREMRITSKKGREEYITVNPIKGETLEGKPIQEQTIPDNAEFDLDFGPEEAGGEEARKEYVLTLLAAKGEDGLPLVTRKWALDKLDIEDADLILQQIDAEKQMQAQAMAAQAPAEAGSPEQGGAVDQVATDPMGAITQLLNGE
jgi:hypothetical protein